MSTSNILAAVVLGEVKSTFDGGFIYVYAGPVPSSPNDALDMDSSHTELLKLSVDGDGSTGLTFGSPVGTVLPKNPSETWEGLIAFDGVDASETELAPTFYRLCTAGDNGRGAGSASRIQGTAGGPSAAVNINFDTSTFIRNGSNTKGLGVYNIPLIVE